MEVSAQIMGDGSLKIIAGQHEAIVADPDDAKACQAAIDLIVDNATGGLRHRLIMASVKAVGTEQ